MKILGLIGGIAPPSTVDYYQRLVAGCRERSDGRRHPHVLVDSIDLSALLALVEAGAWSRLVDLLTQELERLSRAGAELAAVASNTPHRVFDPLRERSPLPLVSIVEACADRAAQLGRRRLALFGTRFTMEGGFYQEVFARAGLSVVTPEAEERALIHDRYIGELIAGVFRDETRAELSGIARRMIERDAVDALILGGTELPLLLDDEAAVGMPCLNTTAVHVERLLDEMSSS